MLGWIDTELGKTLSKETLKRVLKSMDMSWHRARRVLFNKPEEQEYNKKKAALEMLQSLERKGYLTIYYMDESGFLAIDEISLTSVAISFGGLPWPKLSDS